MFGPMRTTRLSYKDYEAIIQALERNVERLRAEAIRHRDAYTPLAWAKAMRDFRWSGALMRRLTAELETMPAPSDDDRAREVSGLRQLAQRLPRTKANAALHHADVLARRKAKEERIAAFWRNREMRRSGTRGV